MNEQKVIKLDKTIKDLEFLLKNNHGFLFGVREALELLKKQKEEEIQYY